MEKLKFFLVGAVGLSLCGCAASISGDIKVDRSTAQAMLDDRTVAPFAEIQLGWKNYPYRSPTDSIAGGTTVDERGLFRPPEIKPVPVPPGDQATLLKRARKIFSNAGLYDKQKGHGTLRLELTSMNRWTYGELFRSYLVETGFIFLIPSSLRVNYLLTADFETSTGTARVETLGQNKTTFHLLLAPLYPFLTPGGREKGLLKQMFWRSATDIYDRLKRAAAVPPQAAPSAAPPVAGTPAQEAKPAAPPAEEIPDD